MLCAILDLCLVCPSISASIYTIQFQVLSSVATQEETGTTTQTPWVFDDN